MISKCDSDSRFSPYPAYKPSGVEWLGDVPEHWLELPIWTLFIRKTDRGYEDLELLSVYRDYGVIIKSSRDDNYNKPSLDLSAYLRVVPSDLVTNKMKTWQGSIGISEYEGIVSPAYYTCRAVHKEHDRYIHYLLRCEKYVTVYMSLSKGIRVNQWDLEYENFRRIPVLLPPVLEQRAIAAFLDRETAKIDVLVAKKERLIELLEERRTALISRAVTRGLNADAPLKPSGVPWLGDIPEHWRVLPLKRLVAIKITDGPHETPEILSDGIPFVSAEAIKDSRIDFNAKRGYISEDQHIAYCRKCYPRRDDVFLCKSGATTGKAAIVDTDDEFSVWSPLAQIRADSEKALPRFIFIALQAGYVQDQIRQGWSAGTQPNIAMSEIEKLLVIVPSIREQRDILKVLDRETAKTDALVAKVREGIEKLTEYRTALISAAVTGKIDVRG